MVDPDAPSRGNPRAAPWLHWLVTNIRGYRPFLAIPFFLTLPRPSPPASLHPPSPGESLRAGGEVGGEEVVRYAGPSPPLGSGPHRYALLVWRQEGRAQVPAPRGRGRFGLTQLTTNYDLGHPVAANFFYAENT